MNPKIRHVALSHGAMMPRSVRMWTEWAVADHLETQLAIDGKFVIDMSVTKHIRSRLLSLITKDEQNAFLEAGTRLTGDRNDGPDVLTFGEDTQAPDT